MDTVTVVIHMTGLLMLTQSGAQVHVNIPATDTIMSHVAEVAYFSDVTRDHCARTQTVGNDDDICYVNMNGWSLDLFGSGTGAPRIAPGALPEALPNLSVVTGRRIPRRHTGTETGRRLKARITLGAGSVTSECAMAFWSLQPPGTQGRDSVAYPNVIRWTISGVPRERLRLVRTRLDRRRGDQARDTIDLRELAGDTIHLVIHHVPVSEVERVNNAWRAANFLRMTAPAGESVPDVPTRADHFSAFYDYLDPRRTTVRILPWFVRDRNAACAWPIEPHGVVMAAADTYSCMMASGTI